jgi:hypothetical protein
MTKDQRGNPEFLLHRSVTFRARNPMCLGACNPAALNVAFHQRCQQLFDSVLVVVLQPLCISRFIHPSKPIQDKYYVNREKGHKLENLKIISLGDRKKWHAAEEEALQQQRSTFSRMTKTFQTRSSSEPAHMICPSYYRRRSRR